MRSVATRWFGALVLTGLAALTAVRCDWPFNAPPVDPRVVWQYPFDTKSSRE